MASGEQTPDLLESGSAESARLRRSRRSMYVPNLSRPARAMLSAALVATLIAGAFVVQSYTQRAPNPPSLLFTATIPDDAEGSSDEFAGPGDLTQPAALTMELVAAPISVSDPATTVVGLTGVGITSFTFTPTLKLGQYSRRSTVAALLDCAQVNLPAAAADVRGQVETTANGRSAVSEVNLGAAAEVWANQLTAVCSKRLAAEKLAVTEVKGTIDPTRTELDLILSVRNNAPVPGWLRILARDDDEIQSSPADLPIAAGAQTQVHSHLLLKSCPSWDQTQLPEFMIQTPLLLSGTIGPAGLPPAEGLPSSWRFASLALEPAAAKSLQDLFIAACGGIGSPVLLSQQPHPSWNRVTRILTSALDAYFPPGKVRSVVFRKTTNAAYPTVEPKLDGEPVIPNVAGVATITVTFHLPDRIDCFGGGPTLTLDVIANVAQTTGQDRRVPFTLFAETFLTAADRKTVCRD